MDKTLASVLKNLEQPDAYSIKYVYDNPSNAGPFKGGAAVKNKHAKGDSYYGPFGVATIISCRKVPSPNKSKCQYCDGTGDVHRADGEWLGKCLCRLSNPLR